MNYRLGCDASGWTVETRKRKKDGSEYWQATGYFGGWLERACWTAINKIAQEHFSQHDNPQAAAGVHPYVQQLASVIIVMRKLRKRLAVNIERVVAEQGGETVYLDARRRA